MSSGSATGNPRNKVGLKPGHSLMDWIRLGNSGKDLSGTGGTFLNVTKSQLAQHNRPDDAWLCIRGKVYNLTSYMDFHPGGPEELMKGVGTDATTLFNEVHAWVNYESILQKCVVGHLRTTCDEDIDITSSLSPPGTPTKPKCEPVLVLLHGTLIQIFSDPTYPVKELSVGPTKAAFLCCKTSSKLNGPRNLSKPHQMDWFQQVGSICIIYYTKTSQPSVHILLDEDNLMSIKINSMVQQLRLESAVSWTSNVTVDAAGKVQIRLNKKKPGLWSRFGSMESTSDTVDEYWEVSIVCKTQITHDTYQIDLAYIKNVFNYIPVSHHIYIKTVIEEEEVVRPYTPVTSLAGLNVPPAGCVRLLIKSYSSGQMSSWLCTQSVGCRLWLSLPHGSFSHPPLTAASLTHLVLLAAGTGLTPMVSLITWALRSTRLKIVLVFFNKTEKDIIWKENLEKLMEENSRFTVEHVLSEPSCEWAGRKGHVSFTLLQSYLPTQSKDIPSTHYVCICGPTSFTQSTERCLKENFSFTPNNYYCFIGQ